MSKRYYKYKLLLDENMSPRQRFPRLNAHYDVKHVRDDLHRGGIDDPSVYRLACTQGRVLITENWTDFLKHTE
jgi:predicted nuclease of predicted toxin-antitoxin system